MKPALIAALALAILATTATAKTPRSKAALAEFKRANPCPSTDKRRGPCPGYVIDHIEPLCAGGADTVSNLQWQTLADSKRKDRDEHRQCAALRKLPLP